MRIFLDTNIISELLEERAQVDLVDQIFEKAEQEEWTRVISVGSFYTITFLTERFLRHQGIGQPQLAEKQRMILNSLLNVFDVQDINKEIIRNGVSDMHFLDLEDSYQYHCALNANCNVLLTINKKDFKDVANDKLQILTPQEFIDTYIRIGSQGNRLSQNT